MKLELQRERNIVLSIPGRMTVDGLFECFTLERVGAEIPAGLYRIKLVASAHLQRELPQIENVPGRTVIDIHSGNNCGDSEGCVLVGQSRTSDDTGLEFPAHPAEVALTLKIKHALSQNETVTICVLDAE